MQETSDNAAAAPSGDLIEQATGWFEHVWYLELFTIDDTTVQVSTLVIALAVLVIGLIAAKIVSLREEQVRMQAKLDKLLVRDPAPEEKITQAKATLERLKALEVAATQRLAGKAERKAQREQRGR